MRSHRILKILVTAAVSAALLPLSTWLAGTLIPDSPSRSVVAAATFGPEVPTISAESHPGEAHLLAQGSEKLAATIAAQQAARAAARQARLEQLTRERASRDAAAPRPGPVQAAATSPVPDDVWLRLRNCEAGGNYTRNNGNGYYGAYQFSAGTWRSLGYPGLPHQASPETQDEAAKKLQARGGWGQWPACSRRIGAR
ncbi:MAG TPA: transglycosylase family protein [Acidimicrobiia bacterium]